jgi:hypothetical protein
LEQSYHMDLTYHSDVCISVSMFYTWQRTGIHLV